MASQPIVAELSAGEALQRLIDGNRAFASGKLNVPATPPELLAALAREQRPYATILGCSDSRVPPELIFGAGFGELFVVRVAGNVLSPEIAGSLQYAGVHLRTPLLVVLGHEGCGAVKAALKTKAQGPSERARIQLLIDNLLPGLEGIDPRLSPEAQVSQAVEANVRWTMKQILESPEGRMRAAEGRMRLVGAIYELTTGRVRFLE